MGAVRYTSWRQAKVSGALSDSGGVERPASVSRHSLASSAVTAMLILLLHRRHVGQANPLTPGRYEQLACLQRAHVSVAARSYVTEIRASTALQCAWG